MSLPVLFNLVAVIHYYQQWISLKREVKGSMHAVNTHTL